MPVSDVYQSDPAFLTLGEGFGDTAATPAYPEKILRYRNDRAAGEVGLDSLTDEEWIRHFADFSPLPDNLTAPIAQRYHGHQFRVYNPEIGDGRGFLHAQMRDKAGRLMDLGTKGSGTTPYSRSGDGRLTLKGGVREVMATEMLEALGATTSRTLSIIETGERLYRNDEPSPTRSAVMVRLNHGHIRIGTFQRHAYYSDTDKLERLTDYCLRYYYDLTPTGSAADRALTLLEKTMEKVAVQAAQLMASGFVHGVLNTDNINITGEIFDFGPWRFLPTMDLDFTAAYFDETGLYAFGRQPDALHWNIYQLGGALADIADQDALKQVLAAYPRLYLDALRVCLVRRLGVKPRGDAQDDALLQAVNDFLIKRHFPYEQFFYDWYGANPAAAEMKAYHAHTDLIQMFSAYEPIRQTVRDHVYFQSGKPCTMLIEEVEDIWSHIDKDDNWQPLYTKIEAIRTMGEALA